MSTLVRTPCFNEGEIDVINPEYEGYLNIYTGGPISISGKVGVCRNGVYDSVCDVNWDARDAAVLCRAANSQSEPFNNPIMQRSVLTSLPLTLAVLSAVSKPLHGLSAGLDPVSLQSVNCGGDELIIDDCATSPPGVLDSVCREPNRTAGVICSTRPGDCVESFTRLVDGPTFYEGRYEICQNNTWLSVCDVGVDESHATAACNVRGHFGNGIPVYGSTYGPGSGPQLAVCPTSFNFFIIPVNSCSTNPDLQRLCSHERDAGVRCEPGVCK